ncbi:hypothetical protein C1646_774211 [Rhizophagus diaphanus]|nr:hypothetical protein C1646_774211 [Rhizophagus diaphanus] [Rhizophagus sp. MUCL 43196]
MSDNEIDEGYNKCIKEYESRYEWDNEENLEFTPERSFLHNQYLLEDKGGQFGEGKDSSNLYMIKIVTYGNNADEIEKFRCGTLLQGDDSITKHYSKLGISKEYSLED